MMVRPLLLAPLDPRVYRDIIRQALAEDIGSGDVTTSATVKPDQVARGVIVVKSPAVIAGLDLAAESFRQLDPDVQFHAQCTDGDCCVPGTIAARVAGRAVALISAERTALNFMQRLSGIATLTRRFVERAEGRIEVLDTRKTTPTLRVLEKYAVRAGGGANHRRSLDTGILIKENHIRVAGGVQAALSRMQDASAGLAIEIETQTVAEVEQALEAGATHILLDNMPIHEIREAVRLTRHRATVEISGGVTLEKMADLAMTGAEYVSVGAITHSAPAADISFEIEPA